MSAVLAVCALLWPMALYVAAGAWCDRHPERADRLGRRVFPNSYDPTEFHAAWSKPTDSRQLSTVNSTEFQQSEQNDYFTRGSYR